MDRRRDPADAQQASRLDEHQFTTLIRDHLKLIHKVAFGYCRDAEDRNDLVQEIVIQVWRSRERYDASAKASTWIFRIALNVAISFYRRQRRHREGRLAMDEELMPVIDSPSAGLGEELEQLQLAIEGLNELDRALVLLYLEGNDHATTAEVLGISVSNVSTSLSRVKAKLKRALEAHKKQTGG